MRVLESIEANNFRNLMHLKLEHLKDMNILIGPNNSGKTNILELISYLTRLSCGVAYEYPCQDCRKIDNIAGIQLNLNTDDKYLKKDIKVTLGFILNRNYINKVAPGVLKKQDSLIKTKATCQLITDEISMTTDGSYNLKATHFSPFVHEDIIEEVKTKILYCLERRLQSYKGKGIKEYIGEKRFSGADYRKLINFIGELIDPAINDHRYEDLIKKIGTEDFVTSIDEQGSGVRSLICLIADIVSSTDVILLIDEPELGLNPFAKQGFLKVLLQLLAEKQIFIATQDPTFVNPVLWRNKDVAVYFYSLIENKFLMIDLNQNSEDPNTFAGYLPHTISIKEIHIYVEGTSDVYIFQVLLEKYIKEQFKDRWSETINKVGIYHLCGDFWRHLLYTIPKRPYKCIVILDGDKCNKVGDICKKHNDSAVNTSRFKACEEIGDIKETFKGEDHPVYCLKENCIEKYLGFDTCPPKDYNKKRDGPKRAEELIDIPQEIKEIFEAIFL